MAYSEAVLQRAQARLAQAKQQHDDKQNDNELAGAKIRHDSMSFQFLCCDRGRVYLIDAPVYQYSEEWCVVQVEVRCCV